MAASEDQTQKMKLREEVENPFRKVRFFFLYSFVASGLVGLLVSTLRVLALSQGVDQGQSYQELSQNIAIDLVAIVGSGVLIKRDIAAQDSRLMRMEIGAKLAGLKVRLQMESDEATVSLSALRRNRGREKRVAIVCGGVDAVTRSLESAQSYSAELQTADIVLVPVVFEKKGDQYVCGGAESQLKAAVGQKHVALPILLNQWNEWADVEIATAVGQGFDIIADGFCVIIKKNGKIGTRSKGCPPWDVLVGDVNNRIAAGLDVTNI